MKTSKKLSLGFVLLYCLAMLGGCCWLNPRAKPCPPIKAIFPTSLDFGIDRNSLSFSIENDGGKPLKWIARKDQPWIILSQENGIANSGETNQIKVTVDRNVVAIGTYNGEVQVNTNVGDVIVGISMAKEEPEILKRKVSISGTIRVEDDDAGSNPVARGNFDETVVVGNAQVVVKVPPPKICAGDEVWVAFDITVRRINTAGDIRIVIDGYLYEETDCDNDDLDGTYNTTFIVPPNTAKEISFTIKNTEERFSDDKADITLSIYNGPAS